MRRLLAPVVMPLAMMVPPLAARSQVREVRGELVRAASKGSVPLAGAWVTLHRVGKDRRGPLDSVRTDAAGRYAFRYATSGDTAALYFVSSLFGGIAYFTPPLRRPTVRGGDANLVVYDTTSTAAAIHVRGHHVIVTAPDSGASRMIVEVYELSNDTSVTRIAGPGTGTTFEALLPDGALSPRAGQGDIPAEAVSFAGTRVRVVAPIAPGVKQLSFDYRLPAATNPIGLPPIAASVLEVLVEDPRGTAEGGGLREMKSELVERRNFRRFLAQDVPANATVRVNVPTSTAAGPSVRLALAITGIGAALLAWLGASFLSRRPASGRAFGNDDADALARQIATLDRVFESKRTPTAEERADHYEARARLKARLTAAIARRDGLA